LTCQANPLDVRAFNGERGFVIGHEMGR